MTSDKSNNNDFVCETFVIGPLATNCYVLYDEKTHKGVLLDPAAHDPNIEEYIKERNIDVEYTINTHGHADHITGNAVFGFPILIHQLDEACLQDPVKSLSVFSGADVEGTSAARLLQDGDIIEVGEMKLEIIHTPGHTPGGISVKCGNIIFSGDTLFFEGIGRTDLPGGDTKTLLDAINDKLMVFPDDVRVLPGHGPETTIGHERQNNPFL